MKLNGYIVLGMAALSTAMTIPPDNSNATVLEARMCGGHKGDHSCNRLHHVAKVAKYLTPYGTSAEGDKVDYGSIGCGPPDGSKKWAWAGCGSDGLPRDKDYEVGDEWCWLSDKEDTDSRLACDGGPPAWGDVVCYPRPGGANGFYAGVRLDKHKHGGCQSNKVEE